MKVLFLHNRYIHRGGEEVCVENEQSALKDAGVEVATHWVDSQPGLSTKLQALLAPWGGKAVHEIKTRLRHERPDILHAHNLFPLLSPRIMPIAKSLGVRTVLTLHNYRPLCLNGLFLTPNHEVCERCPGHSFRPGIVRGCYRGSRLQSLHLAMHMNRSTQQGWYHVVDRFIAPSRFLADKFKSYEFESDRIAIQGHFLPAMPISPPERAEPYILYLGRLSEEKGIRWLIQLFESLNLGCELRVAGTGPDQKWVESRQSSTIRYLGYITGEDKHRAIARATAVVMPSRCYENFPLTVMEANALGVPVIAPDQGGFTELVLNGVNGFTYSPDSTESASRTIQRMMMDNDPNLRVSSQNHARKHFAKSRFVENRLALYETVLAKRL